MPLTNIQARHLSQLCKSAKPANEEQAHVVEVYKASADSSHELGTLFVERAHVEMLMEIASDGNESKKPTRKPSGRKGKEAHKPESSSDDLQAAEETIEPQAESLATAIRALDPNNDDHWTRDGQPAVRAVEANRGAETTRAEIDAAAPGFNREAARIASGS